MELWIYQRLRVRIGVMRNIVTLKKEPMMHILRVLSKLQSSSSFYRPCPNLFVVYFSSHQLNY